MESVMDVLKRKAAEAQREVANYNDELAKLRARIEEIIQARQESATKAVEYTAAIAKLEEAQFTDAKSVL